MIRFTRKNWNIKFFVPIGVLFILFISVYIYSQKYRADSFNTSSFTITKEDADLAEANNIRIISPGSALIRKYGDSKSDPNTNEHSGPTISLADGSQHNYPFNGQGMVNLLQPTAGQKIFSSVGPEDEIKTLDFLNNGKIDPEVAKKAEEEGTVKVIITFDNNMPKPLDKTDDPKTRENKLSKYNKLIDKTKNNLSGNASITDELLIINGVSAEISKKALTYLSKSPDIKKVQVDQPVQVFLDTSLDQLKAKEAWPMIDKNNNSLRGKGIRIAVLDTGVDYTHPDLGGCLGPNCKVIGGYDYINNDNDPLDDHGHGTHCAATAAGDGILPGVAPEAKILAYKVLASDGRGNASDIISAIQAATDPNGDKNTSDHVDVGSMSLGGSGTPDDELSKAVFMEEEMNKLAIVAAVIAAIVLILSITTPAIAGRPMYSGWAVDITVNNQRPVTAGAIDGISDYSRNPVIDVYNMDIETGYDKMIHRGSNVVFWDCLFVEPTVTAPETFQLYWTTYNFDWDYNKVAGDIWEGSLWGSLMTADGNQWLDMSKAGSITLQRSQALHMLDGTEFFQVPLYGNQAVPEPGSLLALGSGLVGLTGFVRRKSR